MVDAYLVVSYGGPNRPEEVVPFLASSVALYLIQHNGAIFEELAKVSHYLHRVHCAVKFAVFSACYVSEENHQFRQLDVPV